MKLTPFLLAALLALPACAPVIEGGAPIALPPGLQETAQLGSITLSSEWLRSSGDFADTFTDEVGEELRHCMWGTAPVDVRVHLHDLDRAGRLETLLNGGGQHALAGTVEFIHPDFPDRIVGRLPVSVTVNDRGGITGLLADREMMVSEAFGRALCDQAFGRNPRPSNLHNATAN